MTVSEWRKLPEAERSEAWRNLTHAERDAIIEADKQVLRELLPATGSATREPPRQSAPESLA